MQNQSCPDFYDPSPSVWISNDVFDDNLSYGTKTEVGRTYRHG